MSTRQKILYDTAWQYLKSKTGKRRVQLDLTGPGVVIVPNPQGQAVPVVGWLMMVTMNSDQLVGDVVHAATIPCGETVPNDDTLRFMVDKCWDRVQQEEAQAQELPEPAQDETAGFKRAPGPQPVRHTPHRPDRQEQPQQVAVAPAPRIQRERVSHFPSDPGKGTFGQGTESDA